MADTATNFAPARTSSWARIGDYFFGRNTLIGLASLMLLAIAGYATWHGMRDFIVGVSSATPEEASGGLSVSTDFLVIAIVVALTFLMWLALRETFGAQRTIAERLITFPLYLFLAIWSIGFGYGFWWSLIAGNEATRTGLQGLQEDARDASGAVVARLEAVRSQLDNVVTWSESQMSREETSGGSCGVPSGAGQGPLYNARRGVRDQIASLRDSFQRSWLTPVNGEVDKLRQMAAGLEGGSIEQRQLRFEQMASEIRGTARSIAARSDQLGKSTATEMRALAGTVAVEPNQPGFSCYDLTLAQRLRQAADQADQPVTLNLREAAFSEGPAGVANAIKNLWSNIGAYLSSAATYVFSGGADTGGETTSGGQPITGRDVIALLATIGVDLGLLALTALNPPVSGPVRFGGLAGSQARLQLPTESVKNQLRAAFNTAIRRAPGVDFEWVRKHFIYHGGASYFVIPNLYSADQAHTDEEVRALAMNQLAGVLDDLNLVRMMTPAEFKKAGEDEARDSYSDLTPFADRHRAAQEVKQTETNGGNGNGPRNGNVKPLRNHGLLSKAQRALDIAKWSKEAQSDVEIYRLVDREGLTPLLAVLNEPLPPQDAPGGGQSEPPAKGGTLTAEEERVQRLEADKQRRLADMRKKGADEPVET